MRVEGRAKKIKSVSRGKGWRNKTRDGLEEQRVCWGYRNLEIERRRKMTKICTLACIIVYLLLYDYS